MQERQETWAFRALGWGDPWRGKWQSLQYSRLENPVDRGAWRGHAESDTTERLSTQQKVTDELDILRTSWLKTRQEERKNPWFLNWIKYKDLSSHVKGRSQEMCPQPLSL